MIAVRDFVLKCKNSEKKKVYACPNFGTAVWIMFKWWKTQQKHSGWSDSNHLIYKAASCTWWWWDDPVNPPQTATDSGSDAVSGSQSSSLALRLGTDLRPLAASLNPPLMQGCQISHSKPDSGESPVAQHACREPNWIRHGTCAQALH